MTERIASLFAEISADTKKFEKGMKNVKGDLKKAEKQTKSFGDRLKTELKTMAKVGAGAFAAGLVIKKAFDFAKQGAVVRQLRASTAALGVDLDSLRSISRGTISDFELMNATQTLLIGTQGDLKSAFIDNASNLLEIAKAANKVNPALGDTDFLYKSIATGIKRSSPLILDNLGLVVKVGQANEQFAKSVGKTVGELSAEEKQMALLNATLKAGNVLIGQANSVADEGVDAYARLETAGENLANMYKSNLSVALSGIAEALAESINQTIKDAETKALLIDMFERGLISGHEYLSMVKNGGIANRDAAEATVENNKALLNLLNNVDETIPALEEQFNEMERGEGVTNSLGGEMMDLANSEGSVTDGARAATDALLSLFLAADPSSLNEFQEGLDNIQFVKAGGNQAVDFLRDINRAAKVGIITAEQYEESFAAGFIAQQAINVELGDTTAAEAAKNVARELGDAYGDPLALVLDLEGALNRIAGLQVEAQITIITKGNLAGVRALSQARADEVTSRTVAAGRIVATGRAAGGPLNAKGATLVGERGQEMIIGNHVFTHEETQALLGAGVRPQFGMSIGGDIDTFFPKSPRPSARFGVSGSSVSSVGPAEIFTGGGNGAEEVGGTDAMISAIGATNAQAATGQQQTNTLVSQLSGAMTRSVERSNSQVVAAIENLTDIVSTDDGMGSAVSEAFRTSGQ